MQMGVNFSVAGTMGTFQNTPEVKPTEKSSSSSQVTAKKTTQVNSSTGVEAGGATEFLKQESTNAVSQVAVKPNVVQAEANTDSPKQVSVFPEQNDAIKQLQDSVNRDMLIAMANSGSLFN